jgi:hypothetical protein
MFSKLSVILEKTMRISVGIMSPQPELELGTSEIRS